MSEDPLSSILSLVNARSAIGGGFLAGGSWAIRFPPPDYIKFFVAARGACWLTIDGEEPARFNEGDVLLFTTACGFSMASDPALPALDARILYGDKTRQIIHLGEGEDFFFLGGEVQFNSASGQLLLDNLPPFINLHSDIVESQAIRWRIDQLACENRAGKAGADFAATQLSQLMFLHILRGHLENNNTMVTGRLRAISDPRIAPAIRLMHDDPGHTWHLAELAKACAMSRTIFTEYFKSVAGVAPLNYLTQWRMHLAERALQQNNTSLAELSAFLGYSSESAFSVAFKRVTGRAPKRYRSAILRDQQSPSGRVK